MAEITSPKSPDPAPVTPPPKNRLLIVGSVLMEFAAAIWAQKHGNSIPDWTVFGLFALGAIPLVVAAFRYDRFLNAGGKVKQQVKDHPFSFLLTCLLLLMIFGAPAATFIARSVDKERLHAAPKNQPQERQEPQPASLSQPPLGEANSSVSQTSANSPIKKKANRTPLIPIFGVKTDCVGLPPRLRQTVKTLFAGRCKFLDRQDHFIAF